MIFVPLSDDNPTRKMAWVNLGLIATNLFVFLLSWLGSLAGVNELATEYGVVPARLGDGPLAELPTIFTAMFLHADWTHLGFNLLFLYIFGDNLEDRLGHLRYLGFYLVCGVAAAVAHVLINAESSVPMIGASGAIFGVVAGYVVLFPRAPILAFNAFFPLWLLIGPLPVVPAWLIAGEYLLVNLIYGVLSLDNVAAAGVETAFFAHLGGAVAGLLLTRSWVELRRQARAAMPRSPRMRARYSARRRPRPPEPWLG